jgi:transcription initiation factor TFIIIB Brf1 subunit/transcription initiation factor TFIIB
LNEFEIKDNKISCLKCGTIVEEKRSHFLPTIVERTESRPLYAYTSDFPEVYERKPQDQFQAERLVTAYSVLESDKYVLYSSASSSLPGQMAELQKFVREFAKALRNSKNTEEASVPKPNISNAIINENTNMFVDPTPALPSTQLHAPQLHNELSNSSGNIISNTNSGMGSGSNSMTGHHSNMSSAASIQQKRIKDLITGYFVVEKLVAKLGLDIEISKKSKELLKLHIASSTGEKKTKNIASMAGALVYELSKKTRPLGLDKVTEITTGKKKHFHIYLKEAQTLILAHEKEIPHVHATSAEQQLAAPNNNVVPHQSASTAVAHIQRIGKLLKLNDRTIDLAVEISVRIDNYANITRNNPVSIAAAVIYIACNLSGEKRTQTEIAMHAGRAEATLRGTLKDLKPHYDQIIPKEHKNSLSALHKAETDTKEDKKTSSASNNNSSTPSDGAAKTSAPNKTQTAPMPGGGKPTSQMAPKKSANNSTKPAQLMMHAQPSSNNSAGPPNILPKPVLSPVKIIQTGNGSNGTLQAQSGGVVLQPQMRSPLKNITPSSATSTSGLVVNTNSMSSHIVTGHGGVTLLPLPQLGALSPIQSTASTPGQMSPVSPRTGPVTSEPQLQAAFHLLQQLSPTSKQRFVNTSPVGHISPPMLSPAISPVAFNSVNTSARVLPPKPNEVPVNNNVNMNNSGGSALLTSNAGNKRKADPLPDESPPKKHKS